MPAGRPRLYSSAAEKYQARRLREQERQRAAQASRHGTQHARVFHSFVRPTQPDAIYEIPPSVHTENVFADLSAALDSPNTGRESFPDPHHVIHHVDYQIDSHSHDDGIVDDMVDSMNLTQTVPDCPQSYVASGAHDPTDPTDPTDPAGRASQVTSTPAARVTGTGVDGQAGPAHDSGHVIQGSTANAMGQSVPVLAGPIPRDSPTGRSRPEPTRGSESGNTRSIPPTEDSSDCYSTICQYRL